MTENRLFKIRTNTGETHSFNLPSCWEDLTLKQMELALNLAKSEQANDLVLWVCLFTSLPESTVKNFQVSDFRKVIEPSIQFVYTETPDWQGLVNERPDSHVKLNGVIYSTAFRPEEMIWIRNERYMQLCQGGKIPTDNIAECIALCLDKSKWSEGEPAANPELIKAIEAMPFHEAMQLHSFFLYRLLRSPQMQPPTPNSPHLKKLARVLKSSKSTGSWLRSIISRVATKRKTATTST